MQLIGFAFGFPSRFEIDHLGMAPDFLRFARIEKGHTVHLRNGTQVGPYYWRKWPVPEDAGKEVMKQILRDAPIPAGDFRAFTLFFNGAHVDGRGNRVEPGFQMSVQMKGEDGWSIRRISEDLANIIFSHLRYIPGPNGPWLLTDAVKVDMTDSYIVPESAVNNWPEKEKPAEIDYFEEETDLKALLARSERLVGALSDLLATTLPGGAL